MIKYNHKKVGIKSSQISYFNISLLVFMLANAVFTILLNTAGEIGSMSLASAIFFILDVSRLLLNCVVLYLTHQMPDNEIHLMTGYDSQEHTNNNSFRDSFVSISQLGEEELSKHDYFVCTIAKKQVLSEEGQYAHEISVIFKPFVYHLRQSAYLCDSLNNSRRKSSANMNGEGRTGLTNLSQNLIHESKESLKVCSSGEIHQVSLNMSFDVIHSRPRLSSFGNYMKEVVNQLKKTPEEIGKFVTRILELANAETQNYKFFMDTSGLDVDLEELELFLNKFVNQMYKSSIQINRGCLTLNEIKTFLDIEYDCDVLNLVPEFSLRMEFPFSFCPSPTLFQKLFSKFLVTGLHPSTSNFQLKIMNTSDQRIYRLERSIKDFTTLLKVLHPNVSSLNFSSLHSEKKKKQMVYLLQLLLNEITDSKILSTFLGAAIQPQISLGFNIPQISTSFETIGDLSDPENVLYFITVQCTDLRHHKLIRRNRYHFEVLSNHLVSKFNDAQYRIDMSRIFDLEYVKGYLEGLIRNSEVWSSIEFQLFIEIAALDFEGF